MRKYIIESLLPDGYNYFGGFTTMPSDKTVILNLWTPYLHQVLIYDTFKKAQDICDQLGVEDAKVYEIADSHVNLALKKIHLVFNKEQCSFSKVSELKILDRFYYADEGCACTVVGFIGENVLYKTSKNKDRVGLINSDEKQVFKTFSISKLEKIQLENYFK